MKTDYKKFAFIGPQCSGKSVLIASLLDRLNKAPNTLSKEADKWSAIRTEGLSSQGLAAFPLDRVLDEMCNRGSWPEPTNQLMGIRWSAVRGKAYRKFSHKIERDFIDIPGERFADFMGLKPKSGKSTYASWSDGVLENFPKNSDPPSVKWYKGAQSLLRDASNDESVSNYVESYQEMMRAAAARSRYLITPSTLITKLNGGEVDAVLPHDFAPMPKEFREGLLNWTKQFKQSYITYDKEVLKPLRNQINLSDVIVIPIDVAWILATGLSAFTDYQKLLESLAFYLESINGLKKRTWSRLWRSVPVDSVRDRSAGSLSKIIICGTKMDIFAKADRGRVEDLIRDMTALLRRKADLSGVKIEYMICSAVTCTTVDKSNPSALKGYINGKPAQITPSSLPEEWPDTWDPKNYAFGVQFDPRVNRNGLVPPSNLHLNQLYEELES